MGEAEDVRRFYRMHDVPASARESFDAVVEELPISRRAAFSALLNAPGELELSVLCGLIRLWLGSVPVKTRGLAKAAVIEAVQGLDAAELDGSPSDVMSHVSEEEREEIGRVAALFGLQLGGVGRAVMVHQRENIRACISESIRRTRPK